MLAYLKNPSGLLVTNTTTFSGMEADRVICISQKGGTYRDAMLRATAQLVCINLDANLHDDLVDGEFNLI